MGGLGRSRPGTWWFPVCRPQVHPSQSRTFEEHPEVGCSVRTENRRLGADFSPQHRAQGKAKGKKAETGSAAPHSRAVS
jgi:hypothetical protein